MPRKIAMSVRSAGVVIFRTDGIRPRCLLLRAYRNWDFPKGVIEPGETPWRAALRETREETGVTALDFPFGEEFHDTLPYGKGKVARYYLAITRDVSVALPVNPELGRPEHHEYRWTECGEATRILPDRLQPILAWACARMAGFSDLDSQMNPSAYHGGSDMAGPESMMKDEHYDIVSTLYHALQGVEVCNKYIEDAEKEGDKEIVEFFHEVQDENRKLATKAKELLAKRVH